MITPKSVAIVGSKDTTYENAKDLLDDFLPEDCQVYVPSYISDSGLKNVLKWLNDYGVSYERVKRDKIIDTLSETIGLAYLIVIGTEGLEKEINQAYHLGIPVYDLAAALWAVPDPTEEPQLPLHEPESHADETDTRSGTSVRVPNDLGSESLSEPQGIPIELMNQVHDYVTRDEVRDIVMTILHNEFNWEPAKPDSVPKIFVDGSQLEPQEGGSSLIKFYRSKTGKMRKAGRSKARPGETEVFLTQEEADQLDGS